MKDLDLLGPDAEGAFLTLADTDGRRYRLPITPALRSAVRVERRATSAGAGASSARRVSPREIQVMLRAGVSVEDVIDRTGADPDRIESYATPVRAERAYVVQRAQTLRVGHVSDAPTLGDLVVDRLAAREVPTHEIVWDATRADGQPWQVAVTFPVGGVIREARWTVDLDRHVLTACDDESRWLSETDLGATRRNLPGTGIFTIGGGDLASVPTPLPDERESLLAQLSASRGTRSEALDPEQMAELDELDEQGLDDADALAQEEDDLPDSVAGVWDDVPGAHPADSAPHEAPDAAVLSLADHLPRDARAAHPSAGVRDATADGGGREDARAPEAVSRAPEPKLVKGAEDAAPQADKQGSGAEEAKETPEEAAKEAAEEPAAPTLDVEVPKAKPRRKGNRRSVPSWDEIVFGTRSD